MAKNNETTTKFKVDISELKAGMQEAQRQIRLANSEFKAATSGMDNWGDSADGINAKITQLNSVLEAEKKKLSNLEQQYSLVVQQQGKNSKGAEELMIKINNQKAAIGNTEKQIRTYTQRLEEMDSTSEEVSNSTKNLDDSIKKAEKQVKLADSEFKAATAKMDDWKSSTEGVEAKLTQLNSALGAEKAKLSALEQQYEKVAQQQGETSTEAENLRIKINNQKAVVSGTEKQIKTYSDKLSDMQSESNDAESSTKNLDDAVENAGKSAENSSDGFTVMKGALANLISDGIQKVIGALGEMMTSTEKAMNTFQAQTGASTQEMSKFKDEMNDLYKNNYGENMDDIAESMSKVVQNSKEADPSKIKKLTENALILKDTFGYDVTESMRAVNMLIDQFGLTGDEAFNLIAQGAQNGLDKNGDLLDTINEYSVHFKQQGYSAEEFFNSLKNGTDAGTFSVDKLGDAMKEFGIRAKDTSTTTADAFSALGYGASASEKDISDCKDTIKKLEQNLKYAQMEQANFNDKTSELTKQKNADKIAEYSEQLNNAKSKLAELTSETGNSAVSVEELQVKFAEGGNTAREATQEVLNKLFEMDDKVAQNQVGVGLFGSMWEDLGIEGVKALMDVSGEADKTVDTMSKISEVRYDDVSSQIEGLGRTLKTDILEPVVEQILPPVTDFINLVKGHLPEVTALVVGLGTAMTTLFIANQIMAVVKAFQAAKAAEEGLTVAQWALNAAQNANPIGIIISLIVGLVAAFVTLWNNSEDFRNFWIGLWDGICSAVSTVVTAIGNFFVGLWDGIKAVWGTVVEWFTTLFTNVYNAIMTVITPVVNFFVSVWEGIKSAFFAVVEWFTTLFTNVTNAIHTVVDPWIEIFRRAWELIKQVFQPVIDWFKNLFTSAWNVIKAAWSGVSNFFSGVWNGIKSVFSTVGNWFGGIFAGAWNGIKSAFSTVGNFFSSVWEGIKKPFKAVADWFGGVFSKAWQAVKDVFSAGGRIFEGIKDGILNGLKVVINGLIKGINWVIAQPFNGINWALEKIKGVNILGVKPFDWIQTIGVPQIPELAKGGVLKKGQVGYLEGDGDEAVVPLQKNTSWLDEIANRLAGKLENINTTTQTINNSTVNNFNQTNNSPKSLSRLEIYRQSKNLLSAKGI